MRPVKWIRELSCIFLALHFVLHERKETSMWLWFHSGWIFLFPLAMIVLCILICILMRRHMFCGRTTCCSHRHSEGEAVSERRSKVDSRSSKE